MEHVHRFVMAASFADLPETVQAMAQRPLPDLVGGAAVFGMFLCLTPGKSASSRRSG